MRISLAPAVLLLVAIPLALADPVTIPNTFSNGEISDANKVDVEGSGENITTISCACNNGGVINAPNIEVELRQVTVENTASSGNLFGIGTAGATRTVCLRSYLVA